MPSFPPGVHLIGGRKLAPVLRKAAADFYATIIPIVVELHRQGLSLRAIARELDRRGIRMRNAIGRHPDDGRILWDNPDVLWNAAQVRRVLARAAASGATSAEAEPNASPLAPLPHVEKPAKPAAGGTYFDFRTRKYMRSSL